jgi:tetratricopeptide (TPR) repeat protein
MKKTIIAIGFSLIASFGYAQNSNVSKASSFQKKGDLEKAREFIELATEHEKTKDKGKTWYTKGTIYSDAYKVDSNLDALKVAVAAFNKTKELEKPNSTYHVFADTEIENLWGSFINEGALAYQDGDYDKAYDNFILSSVVKPADTTGYLYAGVSAASADRNDEALKNYYKLIDLDYHSKEIYAAIIDLERIYREDNEKALEMTQKARKLYPQDKHIASVELHLLLTTNKIDQAKSSLISAIEEDPTNESLFLNLAAIYEQLKDHENARINYKKALEINPKYFEANFNLGASYYNAAAETLKVARDMDYKTYQKEGKKYEDKAKEFFKQALPYMEGAYNIDSSDLTLLTTLQTIYQQLSMNAKAKEIEKRIAIIDPEN